MRPQVAILLAASFLVALFPPGDLRFALADDERAKIELEKTVDGTGVAPTLGLRLAVDPSTAIPADVPTYTAEVTDIGAILAVDGQFRAKSEGNVTATIASYFDVVEYFSRTQKKWVPLGGFGAALSAYMPVVLPPVNSGMVLTVKSNPAPGVVYPNSGDPILGTKLPKGSAGSWNYEAAVTLSPAQIAILSDAKQSKKRLRNVVHFEVTPRGGQEKAPEDNTFDRLNFINPVRSQSAAVTDVVVTITPPTGRPVQFSSATTPALSLLGPGASAKATTTYRVPQVAAKGSSESDAEYLARLGTVENSTLVAKATATANVAKVSKPAKDDDEDEKDEKDDKDGRVDDHTKLISPMLPITAPPASATTTEHLPIVTIAKSGPATVDAGTTETNPLALQNIGGAPASGLTISDRVPGGATGTISGSPETMAPGASGSAQALFLVPRSQPAGELTDTAALTWQDANGNSYGPVSSSFTTTVRTVLTEAKQLLTPEAAGPNVSGTKQTLKATLVDAGGVTITTPSFTIAFAVSGPNATAGTAITTDGVASFTYTGTNKGTDQVQATLTAGAITLQSNTASVNWVTPLQGVITTTVLGRFFTSDGSGVFNIPSSQKPVFTQSFPTINFNPPAGTIPFNNSGVGVNTRPFTNVTTDVAGNFTGAIAAQGTDGQGIWHQAGGGDLFTFNAVFTGNYLVPAAGDITFNFFSDDGFIFGVGNGARRVAGSNLNPPASGLTPFQGYPVMGAFNVPTSPVANSITVHFPAAGSYPYEVDYSECCGGQLALTMATSATGHGVAPAGNLALSPFTIQRNIVGQNQALTVAAMDASGGALANLPVTFTVTGANNRQETLRTGASGLATFTYKGTAPGVDQVQVGATVTGMPTLSNIVSVTWAVGLAPTFTSVSPVEGTVVTIPVPISASFVPPPGQSIFQWRVSYRRVDLPDSVVLASGNGPPPATLATFDPTLLTSGTYAISIFALATDGSFNSFTTAVIVKGNLKLGRYVTTYRDLDVPVNGFRMQVLRTYDSIDKSVGDFGFGWHVSISNFTIGSNRTLGAGGWSQFNSFCAIGLCLTAFRSSVPHYVTVIFPDGHDEIFDFTPTGGTNVFFGGNAAFTARPGTTSTLQVEGDTSLTYTGDGNLFGGNGQPYDAQRFRLTTRDGRVLILDRNSGLVSMTDRNGNSLTVSAAGIIASNGQSIKFTRNGFITQVTGPSGETVKYAYGANRDLVGATDPNGNVTTFSYDGNHNLLSANGPGGQPFQTLQYDPSGRLIAVTDGAGNTTRISTSVPGRQQTLVDPLGTLTTVLTYDDLGDVVRQDLVFSGQTLTSTYQYDAVGHLTQATDSLGHSVALGYDVAGDVVQVTDALGNITHFTYDSFGHLLSSTAPDGTTLQTLTYDSQGRLTKLQRVDGSALAYTYDAAGHLLSATDPLGRVQRRGYDSVGHVTSATDPLGNTIRFTTDASGRITSLMDALGATTRLAYDGSGNQTSIADGQGHTRSFTYDFLGHVTSAIDALGRAATASFDAAGRLVSITNRDGLTAAFAYDGDGRLVSETLPGNDVTRYTYDPLGELVTAGNAGETVTFTYDAAGRVISQGTQPTAVSGQPATTLTYTYDAGDRLVASTGSEGTIRHGYDSDSRLTSLTDPAGGAFGFSYDTAWRLVALQRPNGVNDTFTYDAADRLLSRVATLGTTTVSNAAYTYDASGRRTAFTDPRGTSTYTYNAAGELVGATHPAAVAPGEQYVYDAAGNRTATASMPAGSFSYDAGNRLLADAPTTYAYDNEGDLISKTDKVTGAVTRYSWNIRHQLLQITFPDGSTSSYRYDPLGRRIESNVAGQITRDVYDGANLRLRFDGANVLRTSFVDAGVDGHLEEVVGPQRLFYLQDGSNSVTGLTDLSGGQVASYAYDSFGRPASFNSATPSNPFTYTGREFDAKNGLYYYRSRYYDPAAGRFITRDPIGHLNAYTYTQNDPVDFSDPSGAQALVETALITQMAQADFNNALCIGGVVATIGGVAAAAVAEGLDQAGPSPEATDAAMILGLAINAAQCAAGAVQSRLGPQLPAEAGGGGPGTALVKYDPSFAARQILGREPITPGGRFIGPHAAERLVNPGPGRASMTTEEIDLVLDTGNRVRYYPPDLQDPRPSLRVWRWDLPGRPSVVINPDDPNLVVTVIKNPP